MFPGHKVLGKLNCKFIPTVSLRVPYPSVQPGTAHGLPIVKMKKLTIEGLIGTAALPGCRPQGQGAFASEDLIKGNDLRNHPHLQLVHRKTRRHPTIDKVPIRMKEKYRLIASARQIMGLLRRDNPRRRQPGRGRYEALHDTDY
jgi:hypothetical protein